MVLVRTSEKAGSCFIRTDQLDGETDWKLRLAIPSLQRITTDAVCVCTLDVCTIIGRIFYTSKGKFICIYIYCFFPFNEN